MEDGLVGGQWEMAGKVLSTWGGIVSSSKILKQVMVSTNMVALVKPYSSNVLSKSMISFAFSSVSCFFLAFVLLVSVLKICVL